MKHLSYQTFLVTWWHQADGCRSDQFWVQSNEDQFLETERLHGDEGAKMDSWHSRVKVSQNLSVRLDQNQKFVKKWTWVKHFH